MNPNELTLRKLYDEYQLLVYNLALHYVQNRQDAEEITQDVFVSVFLSLTDFNHKSSYKTWIYRITVNKSLDFLKKKKTRKWNFLWQTALEDTKTQAVDFDHPGIQLERLEETKHIFEAINTLSENQRTAFILFRIEELPQAEIAEIMGIHISAVESLVFRAKKNLQEILKKNNK